MPKFFFSMPEWSIKRRYGMQTKELAPLFISLLKKQSRVKCEAEVVQHSWLFHLSCRGWGNFQYFTVANISSVSCKPMRTFHRRHFLGANFLAVKDGSVRRNYDDHEALGKSRKQFPAFLSQNKSRDRIVRATILPSRHR